jgi:ligand-binding sensor domain-containing protein/signal transduction histidine kinase/AraC-like DNA-binding protein
VVRYPYLYCLLLLYGIHLNGQTFPGAELSSMREINFRNYNVDNGLSQNTVYSICQDNIGFLWFGTKEGLNRFDGKSFKDFKVSRLDTISIGNNQIRSIVEYKKNHLMIGTEEGVYLYAFETNVFLRFNAISQNHNTINGIVSSIILDRKGNLWIASLSEGLFFYDVSNSELTEYSHNPSLNNSISSNKVSTVFEDSRGNLWVGTADKGLNKFDKQTNGFSRLQNSAENSTSLSDNHINCIYEDTNNNLWIGTQYGGLNRLNAESEAFSHYSFESKKERKGINAIKVIHEYFDKSLLLGTEEGLIVFDPESSSSKVFNNNSINPGSLPDNIINSIFQDSEGSFWIGTEYGGVAFYPRRLKKIEHYFPDNTPGSIKGRVVTEFAEDKKGNIWVGTEDEGLFYYDFDKKVFENYQVTKSHNSLSHHNIRSLQIDNDKLWIGLYSNGVDVLDMNTGRFKNYQHDGQKHALVNNYVNKIFRDSQGSVWIGTEKGLCRYDARKDSFITIYDFGLNESNIQDIYDDNKGFLWVGTLGSGILKYNPLADEWTHYKYNADDPTSTLSDNINCIHQDNKGVLWFGSEDARIFYFDYENELFKVDESLFGRLTGDVVLSIIDDDIGNLWIGTNNGMFKYNPQVDTLLYYYHSSDGLQSNQFNRRSAFRSSDGKLYFGGVNGFNTFYPSDIRINTFKPPLVFTSIKLFNEEIEIHNSDSPLSKSILFTREVVFNHTQSLIGIEFAALSYLLPEKNRYLYKLDGYNKDWMLLHNQNDLTFSNLPSGQYTLYVLGSNNDGLFPEEPIVLRIIILPPIWKTTWAYISYVFLIALSLMMFAVYLVKSANRKNRAKIIDLKMQKEKEIANLKLDFFTNIAHEIKTPLMLINGPIERLIAKREGSIETFEEYQLINKHTNRLFNLVNQLLNFRKIDDKNYKLNYSKTNLVDLIHEIFVGFTSLAKKKEYEFIFRSNVNFFETYLDPEVIIKSVSNLLTNAFKFTNHRIEVSVIVPTNVLTNTDEIRYFDISVIDDGIGIEKEKLKEIFNPFYQVNDRRKEHDAFSGIGLGLSFSKSLVELHGGELMAQSELDKGSRFTVRIPIFKQNPVPEQDVGFDEKEHVLVDVKKYFINDLSQDYLDPKDENQEIVISSGNPEILIVEDNQDLRIFLRKHFQNKYNISLAENGLKALDILKEREIDLIISDVMMPQMDGVEFCKYVKTNFQTSHIPIIIFTGKTTLDTKINITEIGADAYVEKPFSLKYISALIQNILENRTKLKTKFSQLPFLKISEITSSKTDKQFLDKIDEIILAHLDNPDFSTEDLAKSQNISRSSLHKKLKAVSGFTPNDYIKIIKLKKAAELLMSGEYRINEICDKVGFNTPSYFSKCFQEQFGVLPSEFAKLNT